jgi:hypothetical protein
MYFHYCCFYFSHGGSYWKETSNSDHVQ